MKIAILECWDLRSAFVKNRRAHWCHGLCAELLAANRWHQRNAERGAGDKPETDRSVGRSMPVSHRFGYRRSGFLSGSGRPGFECSSSLPCCLTACGFDSPTRGGGTARCRRRPSSQWHESERSTPRMETSRVASFPVAFRIHFLREAGGFCASSDRLGRGWSCEVPGCI